MKQSHTLYFTRLFVRGSLNGISHNDSIRFVSVQSAMDWVKGIKGNADNLDYVLTHCSFHDYSNKQ